MTVHKSVLLEEAIDNLKIKPGDVVVDATLGGGGHSREMLKRIGESGKLIAIDQDKEAIERFESRIMNYESKIGKNIFLINDNFSNLDNILHDLKIDKADSILADFGISSDQLEDAERGFSFQKNELLDMRMDRSKGATAKDIVNSYGQERLIKIFKEYGDEKYSARIAKKIIESRKKKAIETTGELVEIISAAIPEYYKHQKISRKFQGGTRDKHFATRVFQALRIETNKELESIVKFIPKAIEFLDKGGRLAVITFHSGEDKIAKEIFRENARGCICPPNFPVCKCGIKPKVKIINKKPILPSEREIGENPRSRSAKLRVVEKL